MDQTVENLCALLVRSRLRSADNVKAALQRWQAEAKGSAGNVNQFVRWLVARQILTEYQAGALLKGRAEDLILNQYQILERLGRGRMAGVFKAVHTSGEVVAIKVLPPSRAKMPQMLARFQREGNLSLKLRHPNVVRSFQMGQANHLYFLVMEYLEGETLEETLQRRKRLPVQEAVRLVHQALMGLQHIHELGIVHRDLKPANLMLVPAPAKGEPDVTLHGTVKILDIGLGRDLFEETGPAADGREPGLTSEGAILGSPGYLAPEQARDSRGTDIRADIYSLGCVLYQFLTGQPPFVDKNILNLMVRHANETPRPLKDFMPSVPDGLQQIVNMMLAKEPSQRYATPERAGQALQAFQVGDSAPAGSEEPPSMKKYLTWLETSNPESDAQPAIAETVPAVRPPAPPAKAPIANTPAAPAPVAITPSAPAPLAAADIDVELVSISADHASSMVAYVNECKKVSTALILCLLWGLFGAHRFYLRQAGSGVIMLLFGLFCFPVSFIWAIIDLFLIGGMVRSHNRALADRLDLPER